jgi:CheY-like chemotaxis protein
MAKKMNEFVKNILFSNRKVFVLVLVGVYILMLTNHLGYGLVPSFLSSLLYVMSILFTALVTFHILIRKLLMNRKKRRYIVYYVLCSLIFVGSLAYGCTYLENRLFDLLNVDVVRIADDDDYNKYFSTIWFTYFICNVVAFRRKMQEDSRQNELLSIEKKEMEMKTLKSQINTHFLHNALNNIYSMIYFGNKDEAAKYVMKLSQMLRYVLDDCEADRVPIDKEVAYIENYIDFQKARFDTDKDICFNHLQHSTGVILLPPMIFQPLIENCFKYCPLEKADSYVHIALETNDKQIRFTCENTQNKIEPLPDKKRNGIGINNLKKRLYISYCPNVYEAMDVMQKESIDILILDIQMPDMTGIEFARSLNKSPVIIFSTAFSEYAVESYELEVADYLLKPIEFPRFLQAVYKAQSKIESRNVAHYVSTTANDFLFYL